MRGWLAFGLCALGCEAPPVLLLPSDAGADTATLEAVYRHEGERICAMYAECSPSLYAYVARDRDDCIRSVAELRRRITSGFGVVISAESRLACIDAVTSSCAAFARFNVNGLLPEVCRVPGLRGDGEPCSWGRQCKSLYCANSGVCGVCVSAKPEGASCADGCGGGLTCVSGACVRLRDLHEACDPGRPCFADLVCRKGVCEIPAKIGDECSSDAPCSQIVGSVSCNLGTGRCEGHRTMKLGERCGEHDDGVGSWCEHGAACQWTLPSGPGVCVEARPSGDSCGGSYLQGPCVGVEQCILGRCQLPDEAFCPLSAVP